MQAAIVSRGNSDSLRSQRRKTTAAPLPHFYGRVEANAGAGMGERSDESRGYFLQWWQIYFFSNLRFKHLIGFAEWWGYDDV